MDSSAGNQVRDPDEEARLLDVTNLPLRTLTTSDDSVLDAALRRLLAEIDQPRESFAGFGDCP
jgi:FXSXX-COOH protein